MRWVFHVFNERINYPFLITKVENQTTYRDSHYGSGSFRTAVRQSPQIVLVTAISLFVLTSIIIYGCCLHPLAHVPGPFLAKFSPVWGMRALYRMKFNSELQALHKRYGPVVRIAPNEVSFATFEAEAAIYAKQEDGRFSKAGTFLTLFSDLVLNAPTLITIPDPALHKRLHKVIQQAFTPQALASQEPIQKQHIRRAVPDFDETAANGSEMDLAD